MRWITGAMMIGALGACCNTELDQDPKASSQHVIEAIMGMYQAFQQADLPKVGKYMTADTTCYDATKSVMLIGRQAVLDHFGAILAQHKPGEAWESSIEGMHVTMSRDLAVATYQVKTSAGGMHAIAAVTHVFQRHNETWLAVHLHRSWNIPAK